MEILLCISGIAAVLIFLFLLNTARKKTPIPKSGKRDFAPVYLSLADHPESIMQGMDKFAADVQKTETAGDKWRWTPLLIFIAGAGLICIDLFLDLLGYFSFIFTLGGIGLWIAAIILALALRKSDSQDFSPRYNGAKQILYTLRDDLRPQSTFMGHLDLTGAMLPSKVTRSAKDTQDRTTEYFRDEWLALKAKLYDGNILRLSAIQRSKQRRSYWKRGSISGKMKLRPAKFKGSQQQLKLRIAVNPEVYNIVPNREFIQGANIGKYTLTQLITDGGIIDAVASSPFEEVETEHILGVLHSAYSLLQRKAA